jgi:hypothetical protein
LAARSRPGQPRSSWAIRRVVGTLEAKARFTTGMPDVFVRVGQNGDGADTAYFLDLGDPSGRAIAIRDRGWSVVDRPDVDFRRPGGLLRLPVPARDGSIDLLRDRRLCAARRSARSLSLPAPARNPRDATANREEVLAGVSRRLSADLGRRARRDRRRPARTAVSQS